MEKIIDINEIIDQVDQLLDSGMNLWIDENNQIKYSGKKEFMTHYTKIFFEMYKAQIVAYVSFLSIEPKDFEWPM